MIRTQFARAAAIAAGLSMVLTSAIPAGAVTVAELQAQIQALMAQLAALQGGTTTTTTVTFTRDLTVGSSGSDVTALQQTLVAQGYLTMPAGVAYGYFGSLTKAATARWQAAAGLPATGFFGPMSRAKIGAVGGTTTGGTTTGGTTTGGTTTTGTITTPGAEGTLTVTAAPVSNTTYYEGENMDTVLAFNAKATGSDIAIQRVKVDLGTNSDLYNRVFSTIYVVDDAGNKLASLDMNSTNVVKDSDSHYYATLSGFSSVVSKGTQRVYSIKADLRSSIDSTYRTSYTALNLPVNGVRGVDGAGIDLYGPTTAISASFTVATSLAESAQLTLSTGANTPAEQEVVANNGSNNDELDKLVLLTFDVKADKDNVKITDINNVTIASTGSATASTTYLYAGNGTSGTLLGSQATSGSMVSFSNVNYTIPKGTTQTFTIASNVRSATTTASTFTATLTGNSTNVVGENSIGDTVTNVSGSATGNTITVYSQGPVITLSGTPSITKDPGLAISTGTSSAKATFNIHIKAVGGDVYFGTQAASSTFGFGTYQNGALTTLTVASTTSWSTPSTGVVTSGINSTTAFKLQQGNEVTIPVDFYFEGRNTSGSQITSGAYAVGLESVKWSLDDHTMKTSSFMGGQTAWRTSTVIMP